MALLTAVILGVYAAARALLLAADVILLAFLSVVLATVLRFPIDWMARKLPRWLAVLITLVAVLALLVGVGFLVAPTIREQAHQLPRELADARDKVLAWWQHKVGAESHAAEKLKQEAPAQAARQVWPLAHGAVEGLSAIIGITVLAFFLAAEGDALRLALRRFVPKDREAVYDECWHRAGHALHAWTRGILVSMTIMGVLCGLGLWLVGVDTPLILGIVTFFATFVPYVGAIVSSLPGLAVALGQSPRHFVLALVVYVVVHHVEGYLVQPLVMRRAAHMRPAMLLFWQALMAAVFGLPGVLVATPLLACAQPLASYLWIERALQKRPQSS